MSRRLLFTVLTAAAAFTALAPSAQAGLGTWTSLGGLTTAAGADHVREYTTGALPTQVYAATEDDGVFRSTNAGVSWSAFNSGLEGIPGAKNVRTVFKDGSRMLAGTSAGLFASTNGGAWQPIAQGPEDNPAQPKKLNTAVQTLYQVPGGALLAGGFSSGVFRSTDGGNTWIHPAPGNGMPAATTVWHMTSFVPNVVLAATSSGIFRSLDAGASWTPAGDGISGVTLRIYKDTINPAVYYAGTTDGVYRTANAGITWHAINGSGSTVLNANTVRGMLIRGVGDQTRLYAATEKGLWVGTGKNTNPLNQFDLGPVKWRHIDDAGLGGHNIFWTIADFNPALGSFIAGTDGNGGYALTLILPFNTVKPAVTGTLEVGKTVETSNGTWGGTKDITYTYQWQRCTTSNGASCTDIDDADQKTYTLRDEDKNKYVRSVVTAENDVETFVDIDKASDPVGAIAGDPSLLPGASVKGNATIETTQRYSGEQIDATPPTFIPAATSFAYRWYRCPENGNTSNCEYIGQTASDKRTLTDADVNKRLAVKAVGTNSAGSAQTDDFGNVSNIVRPKQATNLVAPFLEGAPVVGDALIANVGKWEYPGTTYERQWIRCDAAGGSCETLSGQKGAIYKLTAADLGKRLKAEIKADSNEAIFLPNAVFKQTPLSGVVVNPPAPAVDAPAPAAPAPVPAPPAPPVQAADTVAPVISGVTLAKAKVKRGGTLTISLRPSEAGSVRVQIQRLTKGRKVGKACKTGRKKGKRCTIAKTVLTKTLPASAGSAKLAVALKAGGKALPTGSYRAVVTPVDAAGNRGAARTVTFKITRR